MFKKKKSIKSNATLSLLPHIFNQRLALKSSKQGLILLGGPQLDDGCPFYFQNLRFDLFNFDFPCLNVGWLI
jgi:hypothetical protein